MHQLVSNTTTQYYYKLCEGSLQLDLRNYGDMRGAKAIADSNQSMYASKFQRLIDREQDIQ